MDYEALRAFVAARVVEDGDCLRWTGPITNGHPSGSLGGVKGFLIRRALHEAKHGPLRAGLVMRCTCETPLCVAEDHCRATTHQVIAKECGARGLMSGPVRSARIAAAKRVGPQAKLTQEQAREIRMSDERGSTLARRYNVSPSTVSRIKRGQVRREITASPWAGLGGA